MDRATSFDSSGPSASSSSSRGGGPGGASSSSGAGTRYSTAYERPSSAMAVHPQAQGGYNSHSHSHAHAHAHASASAQHSRNSSMSSSASPYGQPIPSPSFYPSYSHAQAQHGHAQPSHNQGQMPWSSQLGGGNWASSAIPASAFYPAPFSAAASAGNGGGSGSVQGQGQGQAGSVFQTGFQQSQPDFAVAAWAGAYQQMMMAQHFQNQHNQQQQQHNQFQLPLPPPTAASQAHSQMGGDVSEGQGGQARRRTSSGPSYVQPRVVAGSIFAAGGGEGNGNGNGHGPGTGAGAGPGSGVGQGWPSITHRQSFDDGRSRPSALVHALPSYSQRSASDTRYAPNQNFAGSNLQQQNLNQNQQQQQQQGGGYHPYKRNTSGGGPSRKSSKEELKGAVSGGRGSPVDVGGRSGMGVGSGAGAGAGAGIGLPRSKSQPSLASVAVGSPGPMAPMSAAGAGHLPSGATTSTEIAAAPSAANASAATPAAPPTQAEGVPIATAPASTGDSIVPADEVVRARTISGESKVSTGSGGTVTPGKADTTITAVAATSPTPAPALRATGQKPAVRSASAAPSVPAPNTASATATATATATVAPKSSMAPRASTPLYAGQITNATNTPHPHPQAYSPAPTPELAEKKSIGGLKGRLAKALHKDRAAREGKMGGSTPPSVVVSSSAAPLAFANTTPSRPTAAGAKHHQSPSESSTRSGTPPITPPAHVHSLSSQAHSHAHAQGLKQSYGPASSTVHGNGNGDGGTNVSRHMHIPGSSRFQHQPSEMQPMRPPSAPFATPMHHQAMSSDVSLAETERTQRTANTMGDAGGSGGVGGGGGKEKEKEKGKRSLFRMRNMSTDNISLSSTVSSASMMIRKMGSIGKLARRNSLMGISKIFKDKPKDEDGPLPEREGDKKESKKEKKERKKREKAGAAKGELAPAEVSRMSAEPDNDDRVISGLTPAAQLARQHTLRSRAEAEAKARAAQQTDGQGQQQGNEGEGAYSHDELGANTSMTGEPTWDGNTFNRPGFPTAGTGAASSPRSPTFGPNVVHVQPRAQAMNVQHARAVTIPAEEYDSDDSSDGETMEDTTVRPERNPLAAAHQQGQGQGGGQGGQRNSNMWSQTEESRDMEFRQTWGNASIDRFAVPKKGILKRRSEPQLNQDSPRARSNSAADAHLAQVSSGLTALSLSRDPNSLDGVSPPVEHDESKEHLNFTFDSPADISSPTPALFGSSPYSNPGANTSAPVLSLALGRGNNGAGVRSMTAPAQRRGIMWAPECAVYSTYDAGTYDRRSEPATCNNLTPELAHSIKQELNAFKLEMPVHPASKVHTHYFS